MKSYISKEKQLILDFVTMKNNIDISGIQWDKFYELLKKHRVFVYIYKKIKDDIPKKYINLYKNKYDKITKRKEIEKKIIKDLSILSKNENIEIVFIKGIIFSKLIYDDFNCRDSNDIDILVREEDIYRMDKLLRNYGFVQNFEKDYNLPLPLYKGYMMHELCNYYYYTSFKGSQLKIKVELLRNIHTVRKDHIYKILENIKYFKLDNEKIPTLNLEGTFICLIDSIFADYEMVHSILKKSNNSMRLKGILDFIMFYNKYKSKLNWNKIYSLSSDMKITHIIYAVLNNMKEVFPNKIDKDIIDMFHTNKIKYKTSYSSSGTLIDWQNSFLNRILNSELRRKEFLINCYKKIYSENNYNFTNAENLTRFNDKKIKDIQFKKKIFAKQDYCIFYYNIFYDDYNLYLILKTEEFYLSYLSKYDIDLYFYNNNYKFGEEFIQKVTLNINSCNYLYKKIIGKENYKYVFKIPFNHIKIIKFKKNNCIKICYNLGINKLMYNIPEYKHFIHLQFYAPFYYDSYLPPHLYLSLPEVLKIELSEEKRDEIL